MNNIISGQCPYCKKIFQRPGCLGRHIKRNVCGRKMCPGCDKEFTRKLNYDHHVGKNVCGKCDADDISSVLSIQESISSEEVKNESINLGSNTPSTLIESASHHDAKAYLLPKKLPRLSVDRHSTLEGEVGSIALSSENVDECEVPSWVGMLIRRMDRIEQKSDGGVLLNPNSHPSPLKDDKSDGSKESKIDIVCLAKGDYIKKLIELHDGDEEKAMNYIKNVGIATDFLEGDFRMIKKIYFDGKKKSQFPIRIKDYKRNKLEYLEENGEWILDIHGEIVGKRLCENIVSTLLIANTQFNEVIINEQDEDRKELLLDLFQINKTQAHIMKLLERKTQGKLSRRVAEFINYCTEVQAETGSLDNVKKVYN